jgi:protein phosphatase
VLVSDGVGGNAGGGRAAELALNAAVGVLGSAAVVNDDLLVEVIRTANRAVRSGQARDAAVADMAATLTVGVALAVGAGGSRWLVANVGDSPAWTIAADGCRQLTEDHNLAGKLVRSGDITPQAARSHPGRHVIVRALGMHDSVVADLSSVVLRPTDALVVASDGVSDVLDADSIFRVIRDSPTARVAAQRLVAAALAEGATDNVTAAVARHRT